MALQIVKITTEQGYVEYVYHRTATTVQTIGLITKHIPKGNLRTIVNNFELIKRNVQANYTNCLVELVDYQEVYDQGFNELPTAKVIENSPTASKHGIQPWHHITLCGQYAIVYVWDTRLVHKIIKQSTLDVNDLVQCHTDNGLPLSSDPNLENVGLYHSAYTMQVPSEIKGSQINL